MPTINAKQVALLNAKFTQAKIYTCTKQLDWLFEEGIDVDRFEQITNEELSHALLKLEQEIHDA